MPNEATIIRAAGYPVIFGAIESLPHHLASADLAAGRCLVVTDDTVGDLFLDRLTQVLQRAGWTPGSYIVKAGEESKSAATLSQLYDWALQQNIDRATPIVAIGGGVIGDLAGYFAATTLRGLPLVHVPTTLVAQVDSSIGGKTGINHSQGKNLIGSFYRPRLVLSDVSLLDSLPRREWLSGLAETIKHALIADDALFDRMESRWNSILDRSSTPGDIVRESASVKVRTVAEDEFESGKRMLLNFGHTFGHALERAAGYGTISHGQAVAVGMVAASILSRSFSERVDVDRITSLLGDLLPDSWRQLPGDQIVGAMATDKKRDASGLRVVLLDRIGAAYVRDGVPTAEIAAAFEAAKMVI